MYLCQWLGEDDIARFMVKQGMLCFAMQNRVTLERFSGKYSRMQIREYFFTIKIWQIRVLIKVLPNVFSIQPWILTSKCIIWSLLIPNFYSQTWVNEHRRITTTCLQRPPFWGPIFNFYNIKLPLNNDHLSTMATNLGSRGWSLYTCLTVPFYEVFWEVTLFVVKLKCL